MFKKLLNVGKGHSNDKLQQQLQQQKNLFQFNEIKSYGFSKFTCLGYSPSLSLLAAGSHVGQLSVFGGPTVEFTYQLPVNPDNGIRQIEFIDCRLNSVSSSADSSRKHDVKPEQSKSTPPVPVPAKLIVLTNTSYLHLFELRTCEQQNYTDNTTQTDAIPQQDCCHQSYTGSNPQHQNDAEQPNLEFTKLVHVGAIDYFKFKVGEDEDKSKRVTTIEVCADNQSFFVGTESGNLYLVPLSNFDAPKENKDRQTINRQNESIQQNSSQPTSSPALVNEEESKQQGIQQEDDETTAVNLNDEPQIRLNDDEADGATQELFDMIKYEDQITPNLGEDIKPKKQGAIESIRRHPLANDKILISYHRGLNVIYNLSTKTLEKYFYHNETTECSCFADQLGEFFYTSHTDGSYVKWDTRGTGNQASANEEFLGQLYGPYPCKPIPKVQACKGLVNDQLEDLLIFSGGMPRATYDDKHPVTIVRTGPDGKDTIKTVLDFSSKVLDFVVLSRPRGQLGSGAKSTGGNVSSSTNAGSGGGKKNKNKQQKEQLQLQQQQQRPIAVALAILAEEEFVVIDLLNSESYLEFALPYLNCIHSSAITCSEHCSNVSDELYEQLVAYSKRESKGKLSPNEWPITGGRVIDVQANSPSTCGDANKMGNKPRDLLITGHEDGSVNLWDVTELSMRHIIHLQTSKFFAVNDDDDLVTSTVDNSNSKQTDAEADRAPADETTQQDLTNNDSSATGVDDDESAWPPLKRVGRFDPFSDDTRLAIRKVCLCPVAGTLVAAGTGGQVLVFELHDGPAELARLELDNEIQVVQDQRFTWKGKGKLQPRAAPLKFSAGSYQLSAYVQLDPPAAPTSLALRSDWRLLALGISYGFVLYDYANKEPVVSRCTLNVQDFAIISGDAPGTGAMSRKKSFRKSLRESFRRLRRGRSQRTLVQVSSGTCSPTMAVAPTSTSSVSSSPTGVDQPVRQPFARLTTGVRTINPGANQTASEAQVPRSLYANERQVEQKVDLGSIVKCLHLSSAVIGAGAPTSLTPSLWVGTNSGLVLVYAITLAESPTSAKLVKEIQLKHRAPIVAILTSPCEEQPVEAARVASDSAASSKESSPEKRASQLALQQDESGSEQQAEQATSSSSSSRSPAPAQAPPAKSIGQQQQQARVLICTEEQFKVFNLPNLKPFCKFKLTAHEGLRAKAISITQFVKPAGAAQSAGQPQAAGKQATLPASKSLQSFATQTSAPSSPLPPTDEAAANGPAGSGAKQAESNNNSLSALNNNHTDLMAAKFGASTRQQDNKESQSESTPTPSGYLLEPYMVCMSNQGDCAVYSVPELKRQAQIQVCRREDFNGIDSTMLTQHGEGFYLRSSLNFLRFSISSQRVLRNLALVS